MWQEYENCWLDEIGESCRSPSDSLSLRDGVRDDSRYCTYTHPVYLGGRNASLWRLPLIICILIALISRPGVARITGVLVVFVLPIFTHKRGTRWQNSCWCMKMSCVIYGKRAGRSTPVIRICLKKKKKIFTAAFVLWLQRILWLCPRLHGLTSLGIATVCFSIFVNNLMTLYVFFFFPANSLGVGVGKCRNSPPMRVNLMFSSPPN